MLSITILRSLWYSTSFLKSHLQFNFALSAVLRIGTSSLLQWAGRWFINQVVQETGRITPHTICTTTENEKRSQNIYCFVFKTFPGCTDFDHSFFKRGLIKVLNGLVLQNNNYFNLVSLYITNLSSGHGDWIYLSFIWSSTTTGSLNHSFGQ